MSGKQWYFVSAIYKVSRACTADFFWKKNKWMKSVIVCVTPNRSSRSAGRLKPPGVWISVQNAEEDPGGHSGSFLLPMSPRYNYLGLRNLPHCTRSTKINNSGPRHHTFSSLQPRMKVWITLPEETWRITNTRTHTYMGVCGLFKLGKGQSDTEDNNTH